MITGRSMLLQHTWLYLPGCVAELRCGPMTVATIKSEVIGSHLWVEQNKDFDTLHDAQWAVEKHHAKK